MSIPQRREAVKELLTEGGYTNTAIGDIVGVSEYAVRTDKQAIKIEDEEEKTNDSNGDDAKGSIKIDPADRRRNQTAARSRPLLITKRRYNRCAHDQVLEVRQGRRDCMAAASV
jgi:hypothetical protein